MFKQLSNFISKKMMLTVAIALLASGGWVSAYPKTAGLTPAPEGNATQQQTKITVTGTVSDSDGPVIGASVLEKGQSANGTVTNADGEFSLSVEPNATLVISYLGYATQEIAVNGKTSFTITMSEQTNLLDEVVVVGYGTQKKVNLTGSVVSVDIAKITQSRPIVNAAQAMYGVAPGVYVNSGNNRPSNAGDATILIRGQGTMNNSSPLIIIDGTEGSMSSVNPQDIANISILKDAASASIYGSRAANGVILITTKRGEGASKLEYSGYMSFETIRKPYDVVSNYADYMTYKIGRAHV
jgi:TonB-dependent SusC/RagA subfamily outer membrane receptor